jgi:drug/metabolite transporter (DMT)-like permease
MAKPHHATPINPVYLAVGLMVVASGLLAGMHGMVKYAAQDLHPFVVAAFRNFFGFLVTMPFVLRLGWKLFHTKRIGAHVARAGFNSFSMLAWFTALATIPLADATALSLMGPLFVTLGAITFLGERVRFWRWAALLIGASGALFVIRSGFEVVHFGALMAIIGTAGAAGSKLVAKSLTRTDDPALIACLVQLLMVPITGAAAAFFWTWPSWPQLGVLMFIGLLGGLGHLAFTKAYSIADISFAEPIVFLRMVWATLFGILVFAEWPDIWTWIGAILIVFSTSYIADRERREKNRAAKDAESQGAGSEER